LPREFARAFGWESAFVEVQSSWRDKTDLLGYYNAFEKRFYESACLQALYSAQCPTYASRPFIIVLDEMNLSQTEHYFADFLSALEQTSPELRRVGLVGHRISPSPRLLLEGKAIRIPDNVWFVGTANHDESTKDFAEKTYDRAHVMELPRVHASFEAKPTRNAPLGLPQLVALFEQACNKHAKEAENALQFLNTKLKNELAELDLGWGNRFEKQLRAFLPVVVAAGGEPGEALDHLLATKVLRKLRGRFDLPVPLLENKAKSLASSWAGFDPKSPASDSMQLLEAEIRRLRGTTRE
jgi:5-methylcytosine-specific restriction endonuclease McrBC GTP-binding regulatory subunit McrB